MISPEDLRGYTTTKDSPMYPVYKVMHEAAFKMQADADRIEALEKALREILDCSYESGEVWSIATRALEGSDG
jgi:hypothetical protein